METSIRKFSSPKFLVSHNQTFQVVGSFDSNDFKPTDISILERGKVYLDVNDNHGWIYLERKPDELRSYPYFWIGDKGFEKSKANVEYLRDFKESNFRTGSGKIHRPLGLLITENKTVKVDKMISFKNSYSEDDLINDMGYLNTDDDHIYIYKNEKPSSPNQYPYFWFDDYGKLVTSERSKVDHFDSFVLKNVRKDSTLDIINETNKTDPKPFKNVEFDALLKSDSNVFKPVQYVKDDLLTKLTKSIINSMDVYLSNYKSDTNPKYLVSNLKAALISPTTKMSVKYFNTWMEILGIKIAIIAESSDDAKTKMPEPLIYLGEKDSVYSKSELEKMGYEIIIRKKDDDE